jgi:hypothetical protein
MRNHEDQEELEQREWLEYQLYLIAYERKHGASRKSKKLDFQEFRARLRQSGSKTPDLKGYL